MDGPRNGPINPTRVTSSSINHNGFWTAESEHRLYKVERFVVSSSDVKKEDREVTQDPGELQRVERLLLDAQTKEKSDGSESPAAGAEPPCK